MFKNLLIGLGSAGIIGAGGYGIYSAIRSSNEGATDIKGAEVSKGSTVQNGGESDKGASESAPKTTPLSDETKKQESGGSTSRQEGNATLK